VKKFAKVSLAEQIRQLRLIDGEGGGAAFGQRRITVIDEVADVSEQQRGCQGRGFLGVCDMDLDFAFFDGTENVDERGHVEGVAQTLAIGFEKHGEGWILRGDRKQIRRPLALLPQRRSNLGSAAWEEQGSGRGFAELRREESGGT